MLTKEMLNDLQKNALVKALEKFGSISELIITVEELSELQKEVTKQLRNEGKMENLVEEMADVYIVMEYLKLIFAINDEDIKTEIAFKIDRLMSRLGEENEQQKGDNGNGC